MISDLVLVLGGEREAAICRELTKKFEEVRRGTLAELAAGLAADPLRGEVVVVVDRGRGQASEDEVEEALAMALRTMSVKDAATSVSEALGRPRREVYRAALALGRRP